MRSRRKPKNGRRHSILGSEDAVRRAAVLREVGRKIHCKALKSLISWTENAASETLVRRCQRVFSTKAHSRSEEPLFASEREHQGAFVDSPLARFGLR